jgi:hypothetical protein
MTMDLSAPHGEQHFNNHTWSQLLEMALQHGWKPAGVRAPEPRDLEEELEEDEDEAPDLAGEDEEDEEEFAEDEGEDAEDEEEEPVDAGPEELTGGEIPADHPLARLIKSLFPRAGDPVLRGYFVNDGQRVSTEDARALADALERGLPDIPDHDALTHKTFEHPGSPGMRLMAIDTPASPYEWFSGDKKGVVKEFIAYCRQGGFEIW